MTVERARRQRPLRAMLAVLACAAFGACTSTQDVLEPSAITPPSAEIASSAELDAAAAGQPGGGSQTASIAAPAAPVTPVAPAAASNPAALSAARIQFAPIVGPSLEAATSLSERLAAQARSRGIRVVGQAGGGATHLLKGYFTPLIEGRQATVVYVWDVYDPAGNRVHRISGQEKAPAGSGDGWAAVPSSAMQAIGAATIDQFAAWLSAAG